MARDVRIKGPMQQHLSALCPPTVAGVEVFDQRQETSSCFAITVKGIAFRDLAERLVIVPQAWRLGLQQKANM